ncbi:MAG: hypothetical protein WCD01_09845 [Candidatus Sulfotelmatobacter sp.]
MHPLVEGVADVAALALVFDDYETEEAASGSETGAHRIDLGEHAVEGEGHVVVFGELKDREHAFGGGGIGVGAVPSGLSSHLRAYPGLTSGANECRPFGAGTWSFGRYLTTQQSIFSTTQQSIFRLCLRRAQVHDFFGQGEDAGLAGDDEEAMGGIAAEPARPLQAARVHGAVETVPGQGIGDESS